jgi:hypothetical protein
MDPLQNLWRLYGEAEDAGDWDLCMQIAIEITRFNNINFFDY